MVPMGIWVSQFGTEIPKPNLGNRPRKPAVFGFAELRCLQDFGWRLRRRQQRLKFQSGRPDQLFSNTCEIAGS